MMKRIRIIVFLLLSLGIATTGWSKKVPGNPMKWGKVPAADLKMKSYEADSEAEAIVLGAYGNVEYFVDADNMVKYKFTYHRRIKILKEDAIDNYGNVEIVYYVGGKGTDEKVTGIKAQSFSSAGNRKALSKKDIYTEEYNSNYNIKKFSIPNVQVGSVIEYKYVLESYSIASIPTWFFQTEIPVRISRYNLSILSELQFVSHFNGKVITTGEDTYLYQGVSQLTIKEGRSYTMENLQAIRGERYVTTLNDYCASISFYLESSSLSGPREVYLGDWNNFGEKQRKSDSYGKQYTRKNTHKKLLAATQHILDNKNLGEREKANALYQFINEKMKWNERYYYALSYKKRTLDEVFEAREGLSGELNMMLLALLRAANIEAYPVMISTRRHGKVVEEYPLDDQFNHMLVQATIDGKPMFLDTGSKLRPMGYPRSAALNKRGWILRKNSQGWIDIPAPTSAEIYMVNAQLQEDGTLRGTMKGSYQGYAGVGERNLYLQSKSKEHWQKRLVTKYPEAKVDSVRIANLAEVDEIFKDEVHWTIPEAAQVAGDLIYISPAWYSYFSENPLKQEKRAYPVDLPYPFKEQLIVNLELPAGYVVEELPEPVNLSLPNKGGKFQYFIKEKNGKLQLVSKFSIKQQFFEPAAYSGLKKMFDLLIDKHGEQLVLKKQNP